MKNHKLSLRNLMHSTRTEKPTKMSVGGIIERFGVFELSQPSATQAPLFAIRKKSQPLQFADEVHDNSFNYKPYIKVPWALPVEPQEYGSTQELWKEIRDCLYVHIDLPDDDCYDVLVSWVMASWLLEKWTVAPYIFAFGTFGTGKTRILEVLSKLCMRGWLALYMSTASLYRPVEAWHPTLFLDEAEVYGAKQEIIGLLNGSYRKGQYVARQKETELDGYTTEFFDCFGFKGIAGTKELAKTLQSRCIVLKTSHATRKIKFFVDEQRCTNLRNKLLKWRFDQMLSDDNEHFEDVLKSCEDLVEKIGNQREVELFYPLISVAPSEQIKNKLIDYAKRSATAKLEELSLTTEATCLTAILNAKNRGCLKNGRILISQITAIANESMSYEEAWKERFTSSQCSRLGFQKVRGTNGKACIIYSEPLIERLKKDARYSLCFTTLLEAPSISSKSSINVSDPKALQNWLCGEDNP